MRRLFLMSALAAAALPARADLFTVTVETEGRTGTAGTSRVLDFARFFDNAGLRRVVDAYTDTSAAVADANFRGIPFRLSYPANSTALTLVVPQLGITETFQGATRDESQRLLEDWFRGRGASRVRDILQEAVARTSVDPVAGNPNSLMSQMFQNDFTAALGQPGQGSSFGFGFRIGSFSAEDFNTRSYTLPLSYSFTTAGGDQILFDLPLTVVDTEGAYAYSGSFGGGYRFSLTRDRSWTLQPMLRVGTVGSLDIGALATIVSGSVASVYRHQFAGGYTLTLGNMVGHARTVPLNYGGFDLDYRLQNTVLRNGIVGTMPLGDMIAGVPLNLGAFLTDTRFFGDRQRVQNYQEIGLILSAREIFGRSLTNPVEFGFTYLNGANGYRGFTFNTGVRF
jgi:hypothetical protein